MDLSVVVPLYNEKQNLEELYRRLGDVLAQREIDWEIILVDDGSSDGTEEELASLAGADPHVRALILTRNFGQHAALLAGFSQVRGEVIVTLDGDLQNPPEEIPRLVDTLAKGYDVVSGRRHHRSDPLFRRLVSWFTNRLVSRATGQRLADWGSMFRAYRRHVVDAICQYGEKSLFIPTFIGTLGVRMTEIEVTHARRGSGRSKYGILGLLRLYFDLTIGLTLFPVQAIGLAGGFLALVGFLLGIYIFGRRIIIGPEVEGVFTVFAFFFLFFGVLLMAVGLLGEYVSRIYREVRPAPAYRVRRQMGESGRGRPRIIVFGCGRVGRACLEGVLRGGGNVAALVACSERAGESGSVDLACEAALERLIPVYRLPEKRSKELVPRLGALAPELILLAPETDAVGPEILRLARLGCVAVDLEEGGDEGEGEVGVILRRIGESGERGSIIARERARRPRGDSLSLDDVAAEAAAHLVAAHLAQIEKGW